MTTSLLSLLWAWLLSVSSAQTPTPKTEALPPSYTFDFEGYTEDELNVLFPNS